MCNSKLLTVIAAEMPMREKEKFKPATVLKWVRVFLKKAGFKQDLRGTLEKAFIFDEKDLKLYVLEWLKSAKRASV